MTTVTSSLTELADEYWQAYLAFSPISATAIGDRRFDDRLDDPSPEAIDAHRGRLAVFRNRAEAIDPASLDGADAITRSALIAQIASDVAGLETGLEQWAVDPLEGPQVVALDLEAFQPVANPDQARAMVARWHALGPWLDQHAANLRRGLAAGRVAVRTPVEKAVEQIEEILGRTDADLPLLKPLEVEHADWTAADRDAFAEGLRSAVADVIRPALGRYGAVVRDEILPAARPDERAGVLNVEGGPEAYRKLIRVHTSLDLSPDEIHRIGLDEVDRIDAEIADLGSRVLGTADPEAVRSRLRSDPALHFSSRDEVFATAEGALQRARAAIPQWFGILPASECVVVRMGEHEEKHSTIAYYRQPAVDGSRPGQYYVNTYAPETRPRYEAEALAYHESIPGHHLQIAIGQELTGLPEFRKHLGPTAFFEGWGLYTERLSDEMGLYSGDLDRIGTLSFDGWRACRLVVDTGIHALGWSRQRAIDFMTAHTALAANNIANEVDRYIVWPGQALAYKIGQLEILRLRAEARSAAGKSFDIRAFHDAVLGQGAVGLETLAEIVKVQTSGRWPRGGSASDLGERSTAMD
jgi:uncharacterized protein (DUF885 family)